jgi:TonB family protein
MNWPGSPPRLDRLPAIWPPDAEKLIGCGVETVKDLRIHVQGADGGLARLSERSTVPIPQLLSYFHLAEKELSKARARSRGALSLIAVALLTGIVAFVTGPEGMTHEEEKYAELHQRYVRNDSALGAELDTIVGLYEVVLRGDASSVISSRARLDSLVGGQAVLDDTTMSPQLANIVSLRAAMYHDAAVRAAAAKDLSGYDTLFWKTRKLDSLLGETESHKEYAVQNSQRAMTERAEVYSWLQPSLGPDSAAVLLKATEERIKLRLDTLESAVGRLRDSLESKRQRDSVHAALTDSVRVATDRRLDSVDTSVDSIHGTLVEHTQLLDSLIALVQARRQADSPDTGTPPIPEQILAEESRPTFADSVEAHRIIEEAWPRTFKASGIGGTVDISATIDEEGRVEDAQVVKSSGYGPLDDAALSAILEIRWNPAMAANGRPLSVRVTRSITFKPST